MKYTPTPSKNAYCYDGPLVLRQFGPNPKDAADVLETYPWCASVSTTSSCNSCGQAAVCVGRVAVQRICLPSPCALTVCGGLFRSKLTSAVAMQDVGLRHGGMRSICNWVGKVARFACSPPPAPLNSLPPSHAVASLPRFAPPSRHRRSAVDVCYACAGFPNLYQPENDPSSAQYVQPDSTSTAGSQGKRRSRKLQMLQWATGKSW